MTNIIAAYCGEHRYILAMQGHAEGSEKSCNGVSAILWALAGWLENHRELRDEAQFGSGWALLSFHGEESKAAMDMAVIGLTEIAAHGDYQYVDISVAGDPAG